MNTARAENADASAVTGVPSDQDPQVIFPDIEDAQEALSTEEQEATLSEDSTADGLHVSRKEAEALSGSLELQNALSKVEVKRTADADTLVIMLDPGHDKVHGGAQSGGVYEHEASLKIAQYCKAALEEYDHVEVHLTRDSMDCPYTGSNNGNDLYSRVMATKEIGADVYVSFHLNDGFQRHGCQVWIQTSNWKPQLNTIGKALGESILTELEGIGIPSEGTFTSTGTRQRYADGSLVDLLSVLRNNKTIDVPAVLIEHCYICYAPDREKYLSTEDGLRALGEADARGIAEYYGLSTHDYLADYEADVAAEQERVAAAVRAFEEEHEGEDDGLEDPDPTADLAHPMYRLYHPVTHEHLYTCDDNEIRTLLTGRWQYEGIAWYAPDYSQTPVYRLFCPASGEHLYTKDKNERRVLLATGNWNDENIGWYSDDSQAVPVYRMFYAGLPAIASHHYTCDANEYHVLTTQNGWNDEAIAWYGAN